MKPFILNYQGSKYKESKELKDFDYSKYDTIIEVFGGSFGFIRYLYFDLKLTNKKYIVYDNDIELINFFNYLKDLDDDDRKTFVEEYNKINQDILEECCNGKDKTQLHRKKTINYINEFIDEPFMKWLINHNIFSAGIITRVAFKHNTDLSVFDNITFIHQSIKDLDLENVSNSTLLYLDPPYLFESNSFYKDDNNVNMDSLFSSLIKIFEYKTGSVLFIHSFNDILNYIFGKWELKTYTKRFGVSGKIKNHSVYMKL